MKQNASRYGWLSLSGLGLDDQYIHPSVTNAYNAIRNLRSMLSEAGIPLAEVSVVYGEKTTGARRQKAFQLENLVARIREIIRSNRLISEISIKKEIAPTVNPNHAVYKEAMKCFVPINDAITCEHTPLSRNGRVFADPQWLNQISELKESCPERYFHLLNRMIDELVVSDLRYDCEGMCRTEFGDLLQKKFPGVFRIDDALDCFWEHYEEFYGPCEDLKYFPES